MVAPHHRAWIIEASVNEGNTMYVLKIPDIGVG